MSVLMTAGSLVKTAVMLAAKANKQQKRNIHCFCRALLLIYYKQMIKGTAALHILKIHEKGE
jgi:hypothetical protein